jgi:hypothetical protein
VTVEQAERARIGFTCVNDVTARDLQKVDGQWSRAKGFDTFCPIGPRIVEGLDWRMLEIVGRVNGREVQRAKASDMAFSIPFLLSFIPGGAPALMLQKKGFLPDAEKTRLKGLPTVPMNGKALLVLIFGACGTTPPGWIPRARISAPVAVGRSFLVSSQTTMALP